MTTSKFTEQDLTPTKPTIMDNNGIYFANGYIDALIDLSAEMKNIEIDINTRILIQNAMISNLARYKTKHGVDKPVLELPKDGNAYDTLGSTLKDIQR